MPNWTMDFPDGRTVVGVGDSASTITDRNGNTVTISNSSATCYALQGGSSDPFTTIKDALGRCVQIEYGPAAAGQPATDWITQEAAGSSGTLITKVNSTPEPIDFVYNISSGLPCQYGYEADCDPGMGTPPESCTVNGNSYSVTSGQCPPMSAPLLVTSIDLSQAGFSPVGTPLGYSFSYSPQSCMTASPPTCYQQLASVTLPRGASTPWPNGATIQYTYRGPSALPANLPDMPVMTKTLNHTDPLTGSPLVDNWSYGFTDPVGTSSAVTNPDGSTTNYYLYPSTGNFAGHAYQIDELEYPSGEHHRTGDLEEEEDFLSGSLRPAVREQFLEPRDGVRGDA